MQYAAAELRGDREVVIIAIASDGRKLRVASEELPMMGTVDNGVSLIARTASTETKCHIKTMPMTDCMMIVIRSTTYSLPKTGSQCCLSANLPLTSTPFPTTSFLMFAVFAFLFVLFATLVLVLVVAVATLLVVVAMIRPTP